MAVQDAATELGTNQPICLCVAKVVSRKNTPMGFPSNYVVSPRSDSTKAGTVLQHIWATIKTQKCSNGEALWKKNNKHFGSLQEQAKHQGHFVLVPSAMEQPQFLGFTAPTAAALLGWAAGQSLD